MGKRARARGERDRKRGGEADRAPQAGEAHEKGGLQLGAGSRLRNGGQSQRGR